MPALSVITHKQKPFQSLYSRIYDRTGIKMKGYVAVQRKLLIMIYTLWKKNEAYDASFYQTHTSGNHQAKSPFQLQKNDKKIGRLVNLPTLDELPSNQSTEVLFQLKQN